MNNYLNKYPLFEYQGIHHISDDAPMFPTGEGWENSLFNLATYPKGTKLFEIETIGAIVTFLTNKKIDNLKSDIWNEKNLHTAIYVDDLIELFGMGYVYGLKPITQFKYELNQFNTMLKNGYKLNENGDIDAYSKSPDGRFEKHTIIKPKIEKYVCDYLGEDWDEDCREELIREYETDNKPCIEISDNIGITEKGYSKYLQLSQHFEIPNRINSLIKPLIKIEYFDAAIREVSVLFEDMIKKFHNSDLIGWRLIDFHIKKCIEANEMNNNAGIKIYRQELRTTSSFIRNEFMHNRVNIDKENFYAILFRQCNLFRLMEQAFTKMLE
mgnify:CR=1 FL=1|tara:strand:+ start:1766 stop:2743 length:978 start_codon:yes stop_codon:yes gene_type:complete